MAEGLGQLCHNASSGALCYCASGGESPGSLVYKVDVAHVYVSWPQEMRDLDICAYWTGFADGKVGYAWSSSGVKKSNPPYALIWYGDNTGYGGTEHLLPNIRPWSATASRTLRIHLNYFVRGQPSATATATIRTISADGTTEMTKENVRCGNRGGKAETSDPHVEIDFDGSGNVIAIR